MTKTEIRAYRLKQGLVGLTNAEIVAHATAATAAAQGATIMAATMGEIGGVVDEYLIPQIFHYGNACPSSQVSLTQLVQDIGFTLNDPQEFPKVSKGKGVTSRLTVMTAIYLQRIGAVQSLKRLAHNTIFLTFYEGANGTTCARAAGSAHFSCAYNDPQITDASDDAVRNNLDYSKDAYAPHSRFHRLGARPMAEWH